MWTRPAPWDVTFTSGWRQRPERIEPRTYFADASVDPTDAGNLGQRLSASWSRIFRSARIVARLGLVSFPESRAASAPVLAPGIGSARRHALTESCKAILTRRAFFGTTQSTIAVGP
jgi:hypothetical protein